jgi:uncharacterized protein YraI
MISSAALAAPGMATRDVNMRAGPGTGFAVITTIPGGAAVEVLRCQSWCSVVYRGAEGYVSGRYLRTDVAGGYQVAPPTTYVYESPMPPRSYWRYGRPWWDDRYAAWYDGRSWWHNGRWYAQPTFSINFQFGDFDRNRDRDRWRFRSRDRQMWDGQARMDGQQPVIEDQARMDGQPSADDQTGMGNRNRSRGGDNRVCPPDGDCMGTGY